MSRLPKLAELEGDLCELVDMADLASIYVEDTLSEYETARMKHPAIALISPQELRLIRFCVYRLSDMATKLKGDFYEKLEAEKG